MQMKKLDQYHNQYNYQQQQQSSYSLPIGRSPVFEGLVKPLKVLEDQTNIKKSYEVLYPISQNLPSQEIQQSQFKQVHTNYQYIKSSNLNNLTSITTTTTTTNTPVAGHRDIINTYDGSPYKHENIVSKQPFQKPNCHVYLLSDSKLNEDYNNNNHHQQKNTLTERDDSKTFSKVNTQCLTYDALNVGMPTNNTNIANLQSIKSPSIQQCTNFDANLHTNFGYTGGSHLLTKDQNIEKQNPKISTYNTRNKSIPNLTYDDNEYHMINPPLHIINNENIPTPTTTTTTTTNINNNFESKELQCKAYENFSETKSSNDDYKNKSISPRQLRTLTTSSSINEDINIRPRSESRPYFKFETTQTNTSFGESSRYPLGISPTISNNNLKISNSSTIDENMSKIKLETQTSTNDIPTGGDTFRRPIEFIEGISYPNQQNLIVNNYHPDKYFESKSISPTSISTSIQSKQSKINEKTFNNTLSKEINPPMQKDIHDRDDLTTETGFITRIKQSMKYITRCRMHNQPFNVFCQNTYQFNCSECIYSGGNNNNATGINNSNNSSNNSNCNTPTNSTMMNINSHNKNNMYKSNILSLKSAFPIVTEINNMYKMEAKHLVTTIEDNLKISYHNKILLENTHNELITQITNEFQSLYEELKLREMQLIESVKNIMGMKINDIKIDIEDMKFLKKCFNDAQKVDIEQSIELGMHFYAVFNLLQQSMKNNQNIQNILALNHQDMHCVDFNRKDIIRQEIKNFGIIGSNNNIKSFKERNNPIDENPSSFEELTMAYLNGLNLHQNQTVDLMNNNNNNNTNNPMPIENIQSRKKSSNGLIIEENSLNEFKKLGIQNNEEITKPIQIATNTNDTIQNLNENNKPNHEFENQLIFDSFGIDKSFTPNDETLNVDNINNNSFECIKPSESNMKLLPFNNGNQFHGSIENTQILNIPNSSKAQENPLSRLGKRNLSLTLTQDPNFLNGISKTQASNKSSSPIVEINRPNTPVQGLHSINHPGNSDRNNAICKARKFSACSSEYSNNMNDAFPIIRVNNHQKNSSILHNSQMCKNIDGVNTNGIQANLELSNFKAKSDASYSLTNEPLTNLKKSSDMIQASNLFQDSLILASESRTQDFLKIFPLNFKTTKLLYRLTQDGASSAIFHEKCDSQGVCVLLIKVDKEYIFGYFMPVSFAKEDRYNSCEESFVFTIKNPVYKKPMIFPIKPDKKLMALYQSQGSPCLGSTIQNKQDLWIQFDALETSCSNLGYAYKIPQGMEGSKILAGKYTGWNIEEIEIYKMCQQLIVNTITIIKQKKSQIFFQ